MDPDSRWTDADHDWLYDGHTPLSLKFYVSRIAGSQAQLKAYFAKLHRFYAVLQCGGRMSVMAVIRDPDEIREIRACLKSQGRGPP
jgi:hypothetical protein